MLALHQFVLEPYYTTSIVIKLRLSVPAMAHRTARGRTHVGIVDVYKYNEVAKVFFQHMDKWFDALLE